MIWGQFRPETCSIEALVYGNTGYNDKGESMKNQLKRHITKSVAIGTVVAVLAVAGVAGGAFALTSSTQSPAPVSTTTAPGSTHAKGTHHGSKAHHRRLVKGILRRELSRAAKMARHAIGVQVTLHTKSGDKIVEVERGTVTALSATSITVKRIDGQSFTASISSTTHEPRKAALKDGAKVVLMESSGHATVILPLSGLKLGKKPSGSSTSGSSSTTPSSGSPSSSSTGAAA